MPGGKRRVRTEERKREGRKVRQRDGRGRACLPNYRKGLHRPALF